MSGEGAQTNESAQQEIEHLRAEVKHWKDHAEEAGAGFSQVCKDYARATARSRLLREHLARIENLAMEHMGCSGCPTPWWLKQVLGEGPSDSSTPPGQVTP